MSLQHPPPKGTQDVTTLQKEMDMEHLCLCNTTVKVPTQSNNYLGMKVWQ